MTAHRMALTLSLAWFTLQGTATAQDQGQKTDATAQQLEAAGQLVQATNLDLATWDPMWVVLGILATFTGLSLLLGTWRVTNKDFVEAFAGLLREWREYARAKRLEVDAKRLESELRAEKVRAETEAIRHTGGDAA